MILTSRYEGLSFAVLEALACDLPVILSDAPGNRDFLKMGLSHAWSGPVESVEGFSTAIASWAADRADHRECNHRAVAEMRFSQEACFGALVREYESALAR
jgi:glycosyltransferase involved in cell wall biosynthesis